MRGWEHKSGLWKMSTKRGWKSGDIYFWVNNQIKRPEKSVHSVHNWYETPIVMIATGKVVSSFIILHHHFALEHCAMLKSSAIYTYFLQIDFGWKLLLENHFLQIDFTWKSLLLIVSTLHIVTNVELLFNRNL